MIISYTCGLYLSKKTLNTKKVGLPRQTVLKVSKNFSEPPPPPQERIFNKAKLTLHIKSFEFPLYQMKKEENDQDGKKKQAWRREIKKGEKSKREEDEELRRRKRKNGRACSE